SGISASLDRMVNKQKIAPADKIAALKRIEGTTDYGALKRCDLVIDAASENEDIKRQVLKKVDELARPGVIIASNTSSISITRLAAAPSRPGRGIGTHVFNN